jgi:hypothetical protein
MQMHDALGRRKRVVDPLVERKGKFVRYLVARHNVIAVLVELVKVRGGDLLEQHVRRVHEKMICLARNAGGQVSEQQFVPFLHRRQPKRSSEMDSDFPFFRADAGLHALNTGRHGCHNHLPNRQARTGLSRILFSVRSKRHV